MSTIVTPSPSRSRFQVPGFAHNIPLVPRDLFPPIPFLSLRSTLTSTSHLSFSLGLVCSFYFDLYFTSLFPSRFSMSFYFYLYLTSLFPSRFSICTNPSTSHLSFPLPGTSPLPLASLRSPSSLSLSYLLSEVPLPHNGHP